MWCCARYRCPGTDSSGATGGPRDGAMIWSIRFASWSGGVRSSDAAIRSANSLAVCGRGDDSGPDRHLRSDVIRIPPSCQRDCDPVCVRSQTAKLTASQGVRLTLGGLLTGGLAVAGLTPLAKRRSDERERSADVRGGGGEADGSGHQRLLSAHAEGCLESIR
jgi:hypothetical protein